MDPTATILRLLQVTARHFGVELRCLAAGEAGAAARQQAVECCVLAGLNRADGAH